MKINRWAKIGSTALMLILGVPIAANYSAVSERWGWNTAIADYVAPANGNSPVVAVISAPWFVALFLVAFGIALGVWIDSLTRSLDRWRDRKRWWNKIHAFSIQDAGCLLAGVEPEKFAGSQSAKAIANEIRGYVESGHMPTFLELQSPKLISDPLTAYLPPYEKKSVDLATTIPKRSLEDLARGRGWDLPWPIPPKVDPKGLASLSPQRALADVLREKFEGPKNELLK